MWRVQGLYEAKGLKECVIDRCFDAPEYRTVLLGVSEMTTIAFLHEDMPLFPLNHVHAEASR